MKTNRTPKPPANLSSEARAEWRRITPRLAADGRLRGHHRALAIAWCNAWARLCEAERHLAEGSPVTNAPSGYAILSPWHTVAVQSVKTLRGLAKDLALAPIRKRRTSKDEPSDEPRGLALLNPRGTHEA